MKPNSRLKEIEENLNDASDNKLIKDTMWLIRRIKELNKILLELRRGAMGCLPNEDVNEEPIGMDPEAVIEIITKVLEAEE
jgi:hypothetical protein